MTITSKSNDIVKYICSLDNKKYRNKYNKYVVEGIKMVEEIINSEGYTPEFIVYSEEILEKTTLGKECLKVIYQNINKYKMVCVNEEVFKYIANTETPQGVIAVIDKNEYDINNLKQHINIFENEKYIILDKIQDPGNLGTIIRTCVSFGINNIICIEGTVDTFSSKVVRSTMSGILKSNIYHVKENEIEKLINILKSKEYNIISTSLKTDKYLNETKLDEKSVFVMGNEANGVSDKLLNLCDSLVKIPMNNEMESLNVAIASSIVMYQQYINEIKNI